MNETPKDDATATATHTPTSDSALNQPDPQFFARSDAHIDLSNDQLAAASRGQVNASMMYGMARFNAWMAAVAHGSAETLTQRRDETIEYFLGQYRLMLEDHVDDYIRNFDRHMALSRDAR
jgi:hypothetical protein